MVDRHGRRKRKLRLSLTDRCNFRCRYCMPQQPQWMKKKDLLTRDELLALAHLFVGSGIEAIRLTGGEPLLRADLVECVATINTLRAHGLRRISLTTNGSHLAGRLAALRAAGLDDLNISLDALDPARFAALRGADIKPVLEGIGAALNQRVPFKLNTVLVRGHNDCEILPLVDWAMARGAPLRFIEYMPLDAPGTWSAEQVVSAAQILRTLRTRHRVEPLLRGSEPASEYLLDGEFRVGIISTISNPFCASCDRVRLTARGELYTCLFAPHGTPLGAQLRAGADATILRNAIHSAVWNKQAGYAANPQPVERPLLMHAMGG
ncbi:MAG TPA: GTP 3',8-cyclase MoaA [Nevskiaceae bacterium]|nr:GTP 3',8-cyclase MoaA [Nevskiaceae bacterium]